MKIIKRYLKFFTNFVSLAIFTYGLIWGSLPFEVNFIYISAIFLNYIFTGYVKSLELTIAVAILSLFAVPTALALIISSGDYVVFLAGAIIFTEVILWISRINGEHIRLMTKNENFHFYSWASCLAITFSGWHLNIELDSIFIVIIFFGPYAASLVILERSLSILSKTKVYFLIVTYVALVVYYAVFFWSGYGRLMIGAYLMMPILVINQHRDIGLRVWQLTILIPLVLVGAFIMRFQEENFDRLAEDSWSSHLSLSREMLDTMNFRQPIGFYEYLDQYSLLFFQWVPRSIWPTKPIGVGLSFVDDWIGRAGFDAGHSVAVGFIGESLWYLGPYFLFGQIVTLCTIIIIRMFAAWIDKGGYALVAISDSFLPSFLWGGMAIFGSRFWFFFVPAALTAFIFGRIARRNSERARLVALARTRSSLIGVQFR